MGYLGFKTQSGYNYGVDLKIPIFPKKYWKPKTISIKPESHLKYTYYTTQNYVRPVLRLVMTLCLITNILHSALIQNLLARETWD